MNIFEDNKSIINYYNKPYYKTHPFTYGKLGWSSKKGQLIRFSYLLKYINNNDKILDYGCGYGDLLTYMINEKIQAKYLGVDINSQFIQSCINKYNNNYFKLINSYKDIKYDFDWFVASGVFTVKTSTLELYDTIDYFYQKANKGLSFNLLGNNYDIEKTLTSNTLNIRGYNSNEIFNYLKSKYTNVFIDFLFKKDKEFNIYIIK
jgi:SAM-dependent methyltransferase